MPANTLAKIETRQMKRVSVDQLQALGLELETPWWTLIDAVHGATGGVAPSPALPVDTRRRHAALKT